MAVEFYKAIGEGDFKEIMHNEFSDKIGDNHFCPPWKRSIIIYDINDVAVIYATEDGSDLGRNSLRMMGTAERFDRAKLKLKKKQNLG